MANNVTFTGVNYNNLRKALYLMFFGTDNGKCNDFSNEKYQYILPLQGDFQNPMQLKDKDTYILYWIEKDESLTQDDFILDEENEGFNRQKCVATIMLRFVGKDAETWVRTFRHLCKRKDVSPIWSGVCNGYKLLHTMPIHTKRMDFFGKNNQIAFDIWFKIYYDECISTGWKPLTGINFTIKGDIKVEGTNN